MFSIPLFFTMEMWWAGFSLHPGRIIVYAIATFGLLLLYNRFAGLRRDASFREVVIDSVEEMGIGISLSLAILWLTNRIDGTMDSSEIVGKVMMQAMTAAIGVSVGTAQLGTPAEGDEGLIGDSDEANRGYLPQVAITLCGAVLFAANVVPTDEVGIIARESPPFKLFAMAIVSMLLVGFILHFSNFKGTAFYVAGGSKLNSLRGIVTTYAVALFASGALLWCFGKLDNVPFQFCMAQIVVVGIPAVLGASAGRLLLQSGGSREAVDN